MAEWCEDRHDQDGTVRALKRRGILAAAGAVVAGIVAKQTSQPVVAATTANSFISTGAGAFNGDFDAQGSASYGFRAIDGTFQYGVYGTGSSFGVVGNSSSGTGVSGGSTSGIAVFGLTSSATEPSVEGRNLTGGGPAVLGSIYNTNSNANTVAVKGVNQSTGANGAGVIGVSTSGYGVQGQSANTIGVFGATNGAGQVAGVYGVSNASYGVIGVTTAAGYSGLTAITGTSGVAALAATSTIPSAYAAYFTGTTVVQGNFVAFGGSKSAAVKDAAGQHRLVYCVESPEAWFEDFGEGTLVTGRATVTLDKTFAEIVQTNAYHVYLTPKGDTNGLHIVKQTVGGFLVGENKGGASTVAFSWRVVARRKDITGERLAKFDMPKINHPDPDTLPITPSGHSETPKKP